MTAVEIVYTVMSSQKEDALYAVSQSEFAEVISWTEFSYHRAIL